MEELVQKRVYMIRHKYELDWIYIGSTSKSNLNKYLRQVWTHRKCSGRRLARAMKLSTAKNEWEIVILIDWTTDWEKFEAELIAQYGSYSHGLNATIDGQPYRGKKIHVEYDQNPAFQKTDQFAQVAPR